MADFKRILFPVDFSEQSLLAAGHVLAFAKKFDAEVMLLHVELLPADPYIWQPQPELLNARLEAFATGHFPQMRTECFIGLGDPAEEIVSFARRKKADLIMMPTHGRGAFRRFILGSVTAKVLHDTPIPVWTAAHLQQAHVSQTAEVGNLLCAVDLDVTGEHTVRYAAGLARRWTAKLTVAHAIPAVEVWPESYLDAELQADLIKRAQARLAELLSSAEASADLCVGAGPVAQIVAHAARSHKANLVVIGRDGHETTGRLRTHDYSIIRECECPVLSI